MTRVVGLLCTCDALIQICDCEAATCWCKLQNPLGIFGVKKWVGLNLNFKFKLESTHELLMNLNWNSIFAKSMNLNLNLNLVFSKSMN